MKNTPVTTQTALLLAGLLTGFFIGRISFPAESIVTLQPDPGQIAVKTVGNTARTTQETYLKPKVFETITGVSPDDDPFLGPTDDQLAVIEFSDYQCPYCKQYVEDTFPLIKKDYIDTGKIKYVVRDFPASEHPQALLAANAADCALEQNKFWEMHDILFASLDDWSYQNDAADKFKEYSRQLNLNENQFSTCLENSAFDVEIAKDISDGDIYKVAFTPTIFVGDKKIVGAQSYEVFKKVIDSELNKIWQTQET